MVETTLWADMGSALGLGVASSLTVCTLACLPFIGTWVLGQGQGSMASSRDVALFLLGRWSTYICMGGVVGASMGDWLDPDWLRGVSGLLFLWSGWQILQTHGVMCGKKHQALPPFQLGVAQAMTPCVPLSTLLALCGLSGSLGAGAALAAAFGAGAMVSPLLLVVPVIAGAGRALVAQLQGATRWLRWGAAAVFMGLGVKHLSWLTL